MATVKTFPRFSLVFILAGLLLFLIPIVNQGLVLPAPEILVEPQAKTVPGLIIPEPGDHVLNHPKGDVASASKLKVWNAVKTSFNSGLPPDWCGYRPSDGAVVIIYYSLEVLKETGGKLKGLGIILNDNSGPSTAVWNLRGNPGERPTNRAGQISPFEDMPCPPLATP